MSTEATGDPSRQRLGRILLVLGVLLVAGLVVAVSLAVVQRAKVERTRRLLESLRRIGGPAARNRLHFVRDGSPRTPWVGEVQLDNHGMPHDTLAGANGPLHPALDAWGRPLRLGTPGPLHAGGWDIWSFGPNGLDEQGSRDDILIGEDLWPPPTPSELTADTLNGLATRIRESSTPILADGSHGDGAGLWALAQGLVGIHGGHRIEITGSFSNEPGPYPDPNGRIGSIEPIEADDGWNRPVRYRCPGPVHRRGWDRYSFGPNGVDEHGQGDDVLVGDDMAPMGTGR